MKNLEEELIKIAEFSAINGIRDIVLSGENIVEEFSSKLGSKYSVIGAKPPLDNIVFTSYQIGSVVFHFKNR